eukprot:scaffold5647_cov148-Prasinococcus_capsulatus_cf.AAC.1
MGTGGAPSNVGKATSRSVFQIFTTALSTGWLSWGAFSLLRPLTGRVRAGFCMTPQLYPWT